MLVYVGFVILSALLLWAVIYARGPWLAKLLLVCSVPAYGLVVWHSLEAWKGYPVPQGPPENAVLVASLVDEPNAIYLWATPPGADEPRAYRIPYNRRTHEAIQGAQERGRGGRPQGVRKGPRGSYRFYSLPSFLPSKEVP